MSRRPALRVVSVVLLAIALPLGVASGDDQTEFVRERLVAAAHGAVTPSNPRIGGLDDIRKATETDRPLYSEKHSEIFDALDELVGRAGDEARPGTEGVIRQGARLYRWVTGQLEPDEMHVELPPAEPVETEPKNDDGADDGPAAPGDAEPKGDSDEADEPKKDDEPADDPEPGNQDEPKPPPAPRYDMYVKMPPFVIRTEDGDVELPPRVPERRSALSEAQVKALVYGRILVSTTGDGQRGPVLRLAGIGELAAFAGLGPAHHRFPLVLPDELESPVGVDFLQWRKLQLNLRRESMQSEHPQGLVSDAEVDERRARVAALAAVYDHTRARRERILSMFWTGEPAGGEDRAQELSEFETYDWAERFWAREIGQVSFEIEEGRSRCDDCEGEEKSKAERVLGLLELKERRRQQELRLLYITVLRAQAQIEVLDQLLELGKEELLQAEVVLQRYEDARNIVRRERQLARLQYQEQTLRRGLTRLESVQASASEDEEADRLFEIHVAEETLELNADVRELVVRRRRLEQRAAPPARAESAETAVQSVPPAEGADVAAPADADPLAVVRDPRAAWIGDSYIKMARGRLSSPDFDARLVADHYEAADEVADSLEVALRGTDGLAEREAEFNRRAEALEQELRAFRLRRHGLSSMWTREEDLRAMRRSFSETVRGVRGLRERVEARLGLLRAWCDELLALGSRSFRIRVDRVLTGDELRAAGDDLSRTRTRAEQWFVADTPPSARAYLGAHWLGLLGALGLLVASVFAVRGLRGGIDRRIESLADSVPALRTEAVSVRKEVEEQKELEQAAEEARQAAEKAAIDVAGGDLEARRPEGSGDAE